MSKNILRCLSLVVTVAAALFLSGCGGDSEEQERQRREAEDMVYAAYLAKDYPRIIELVDSFRPLGSFTEGKACYWLGYAYDLMCKDAEGAWMVRTQETNLGDMIADAFRLRMKADIGLMNGGYYSTLKPCKLLDYSSLVGRDCLSDYVESLAKDGGLSAYANPQDRVKVLN